MPRNNMAFVYHHGYHPSYLHQQQRGMAALKQDIAYKREVKSGDMVTIRSAIMEVKDKNNPLFYEMQNKVTGQMTALTI